MNPLSVMSGPSFTFWMETGNHLWQSTLFGLIIVLIITLLRKMPAKTRFFLGWVGLLKFALPSSLLFLAVKDTWLTFLTSKGANLESLIPVNTQFTETLIPFQAPIVIIEGAGIGVSTEAYASISPLNLLGIIWIVGSLLLFFLWQYKLQLYSADLKTKTQPISGSLNKKINQLKNKIGLRIKINSYFTDDNLEPSVIGIFSPKLILPANLVKELDDKELETIILHELVHIKRRDNLWSFIQMLFFCVLWFNPVIWWLNHRLTSECEKSCDEEVLNHIKDKRNYTYGIIRVSHFCMGLKIPGLSGMSSTSLRNRLESITHFNGNSFSKGIYHWFIVVSVVLFLLFTTSASGFLAHLEALPRPNGSTIDSTEGETFTYKMSAKIEQNSLSNSIQLSNEEEKDISLSIHDESSSITTLNTEQETETNQSTIKSKTNSLLSTATASSLKKLFRPLKISQTESEIDNNHLSQANFSAFKKDPIDHNKKIYSNIEIIKQVTPRFPKSVLHLGTNKGFANVVFIVDNIGKPRDFVVDAASHPDFGSATIKALKKWKFVPVILEGEPQSSRVTVESSFEYKGINKNQINIIKDAILFRKDRENARIEKVINFNQLDYEPKLIHEVSPKYPENMKNDKIKGNVLVEFYIDSNGNVKAPGIKSSTHDDFAIAALNAIQDWKFEPPIKDGKPVRAKVYQHFNFRKINLVINK